jgi:hypothetical protein
LRDIVKIAGEVQIVLLFALKILDQITKKSLRPQNPLIKVMSEMADTVLQVDGKLVPPTAGAPGALQIIEDENSTQAESILRLLDFAAFVTEFHTLTTSAAHTRKAFALGLQLAFSLHTLTKIMHQAEAILSGIAPVNDKLEKIHLKIRHFKNEPAFTDKTFLARAKIYARLQALMKDVTPATLTPTFDFARAKLFFEIVVASHVSHVVLMAGFFANADEKPISANIMKTLSLQLTNKKYEFKIAANQEYLEHINLPLLAKALNQVVEKKGGLLQRLSEMERVHKPIMNMAEICEALFESEEVNLKAAVKTGPDDELSPLGAFNEKCLALLNNYTSQFLALAFSTVSRPGPSKVNSSANKSKAAKATNAAPDSTAQSSEPPREKRKKNKFHPPAVSTPPTSIPLTEEPSISAEERLKMQCASLIAELGELLPGVEERTNKLFRHKLLNDEKELAELWIKVTRYHPEVKKVRQELQNVKFSFSKISVDELADFKKTLESLKHRMMAAKSVLPEFEKEVQYCEKSFARKKLKLLPAANVAPVKSSTGVDSDAPINLPIEIALTRAEVAAPPSPIDDDCLLDQQFEVLTASLHDMLDSAQAEEEKQFEFYCTLFAPPRVETANLNVSDQSTESTRKPRGGFF